MPSPLKQKLAFDDESVALVLQGGGALGSYQAGVFEELTAVDVDVGWVAGVSIGAINAALIAGNAPRDRVDRLRAFWETVSSGPAPLWLDASPFVEGRAAFNRWSAAFAATWGVPGFYRPRVPPAILQPEGTAAALGIYDNGALRSTLERLVDFDRINAREDVREMRFSIGAVNVATGNSRWFDNFDPAMRIGPEHVMASGALPPAFAPVTIDGEAYWDGGILSNTPLQYVLDERGAERLLVVQVDLFPARGAVPVNLEGVLRRHKDILYSSRSRFTTEKIAEMQKLRGMTRRLIERLPPALRDEPEVRALDAALDVPKVDIVHLIYRQAAYESDTKDYEFSRLSMLERWGAGVADMRRTHEHLEWLEPSILDSDVTVYDLAQGYDAAPAGSGPRERLESAALDHVAAKLDHQPVASSRPHRKTSSLDASSSTR